MIRFCCTIWKINFNVNISSKTSKPLRKVLTHFHMRSFLLMQPLNELLYPFHLMYNLSPFLLNTFSILNFYWLVICNSFSLKLPVIGLPFKSLINHIHGTVFLILLTTKTSSYQFWVCPLAKMFLYFEILTRSPTLSLGSFSLNSSLYSA